MEIIFTIAGIIVTIACTVIAVRWTTGRQVDELGKRIEKKIDGKTEELEEKIRVSETKAEGGLLAVEQLIFTIADRLYGRIKDTELSSANAFRENVLNTAGEEAKEEFEKRTKIYKDVLTEGGFEVK